MGRGRPPASRRWTPSSACPCRWARRPSAWSAWPIAPAATTRRPCGSWSPSSPPAPTSWRRTATSVAASAAEAEVRALNAELELRLRRINALRQIDAAIASGHDIGNTLGVVLDKVVEQLGTDAADILLLDPHSGALERAAARGFRSGGRAWTVPTIDGSLAGRVVLERRAVRVEDLRSHGEPVGRPSLVSAEGFVSYHAVPLLAKGQVRGVLEVFHRAPCDPDPEWRDFLEALAGQAAIAVDNASLFEDLQRSNLDLTLAYDATIEGWSRALDLRDKETEGHTRRVTEMTLRLARAMGVDGAELVHVRRGALLHDIGKMGIPDAILLKPGPLTEEEWACHAQAPDLRPRDALADRLPAPGAGHPLLPPREVGRHRLPPGPGRRADPPGRADLRGGGHLGRPAQRPALPRRLAGGPKVREHIASLSGTHLDPAVVRAFLPVAERAPTTPTPPTRVLGHATIAASPVSSPDSASSGWAPGRSHHLLHEDRVVDGLPGTVPRTRTTRSPGSTRRAAAAHSSATAIARSTSPTSGTWIGVTPQ